MYIPSTHLVVTYIPTYLPMYETYFLQNWLTNVKPNFNLIEVHRQLSNSRHPMETLTSNTNFGYNN